MNYLGWRNEGRRDQGGFAGRVWGRSQGDRHDRASFHSFPTTSLFRGAIRAPCFPVALIAGLGRLLAQLNPD